MESLVFERILLHLGARPQRKGYRQAVAMLQLFYEHPEISHVSEAYTMVGKKLDVSPQQLDRNLRELIREMWDKGNRESFGRLMPWCVGYGAPSNKEFLCTVATLMRTGDISQYFDGFSA